MVRCLVSLVLFAACAAAQAQAPEPHMQEAGSSVVLARSTFAHGYRHGYEEGYHVGNTDINMGRSLRTRFNELHDLKTGYSSSLGPRKVFDQGFQAGLKAGYTDGYLGRTFRAVETLRRLAASLDAGDLPTDPKHAYFDRGFANGYNSGFEHAGTGGASAEQIDFHGVHCVEFHPERESDFPAEGSYCEGYQRGYALGQGDGFALRPEFSRLEASK